MALIISHICSAAVTLYHCVAGSGWLGSIWFAVFGLQRGSVQSAVHFVLSFVDVLIGFRLDFSLVRVRVHFRFGFVSVMM